MCHTDSSDHGMACRSNGGTGLGTRISPSNMVVSALLLPIAQISHPPNVPFPMSACPGPWKCHARLPDKPLPDSMRHGEPESQIPSITQLSFLFLPLPSHVKKAVLPSPLPHSSKSPSTRPACCTCHRSTGLRNWALKRQRDWAKSPHRQHDQLSSSDGLCPFLFMDWSTDRFQWHRSPLRG